MTAGRTASKRAGAPGQMRAYHLYVRVRDVSARSSHCFKTFIIGGEAVSRINAPTEDRVGQLFNGIVITRSLGGHYLALSLSFSLDLSFDSSLFPLLPPPSRRAHVSYFCRLSVLPFRSLHFPLSVLSLLYLTVAASRSRILPFFFRAIPIILRHFQPFRYRSSFFVLLLSSFNSLILRYELSLRLRD